MATWHDVRAAAMSLPETVEGESRGSRQWTVRGKGFVWERPLHGTELQALGAAAPRGAILGAYVPAVGVKLELIAESSDIYFTTPHFDGYPAILVRLDAIGAAELSELVTEAWLVRASKRAAKAYLAGRAETSTD